ncbi:MAG: hypothetical protein DME08_04815 [Candidatus Rokuibacteriota bacterium]|nr:MAG: hypothetical protein DME08_04815 [Candidatus Rokubacteria bacterium]
MRTKLSHMKLGRVIDNTVRAREKVELVDEAAQIFLRILRKEPGHEVAHRRLEEALRVKIQRRKGS